ncbi:unnamed protein product [Chironomus riparius]|uniref:Kazal-like domain-containing protein n=1 Tax=Chironomus riparius TaxID=315576 RepID=A0A9N9S0B8_9DIPT|nr:unnamed protein product [Chironomus riparius]
MEFIIKASLLLISIYYVAARAVPDDGCWYSCPQVYDPICGAENDKNSTQVFGNECIMEVHNTCFETAYIRTDLNNCEEIDDAETLPNPEDFYFNH